MKPPATIARLRLFSILLVATMVCAGCATRRPVARSSTPAPSAKPSTTQATSPQNPKTPKAATGSASPSTQDSAQTPTRDAPFVPGLYVEQGIASWYGVPFNGRRAANGEIFDMNTLVAAHRTLPFGSIVRVTNLNNGRQIEVRVIDRGPFVNNRILDLARAAAAGIGMIGTGTAPVRIELISSPSFSAAEYTVQVGAFSDRANAEHLRQRLLGRYEPISIKDSELPNGHFYRLMVGRVASPDAAALLASQLRRSYGFDTFVLRLDSSFNNSGLK